MIGGKTMSFDLYQMITDRIIAQLEAVQKSSKSLRGRVNILSLASVGICLRASVRSFLRGSVSSFLHASVVGNQGR